MLNPAQFQQGEMFPDTNPVSAPAAPAPAKRLPVGQDAYSGVKPVGMRGSASDRFTLPGRLAKQAQGRARWDSYRTRIEDDNNDEDYDDGDHRPVHPQTGLPTYGEIDTHEAPEDGGLGMGHGRAPSWALYGNSSPSARRKGSTIGEVPLYERSADGGLEALSTPQGTVSSQRLHEALDSPETRANPRIPAPYHELPYVYADGEGMDQEHSVIDGNHRTGAHLLGGQMFMQARVLTAASKPVVDAQTQKVNNAMKRAQFDQHGNDRSEQVEQRMNDRMYGTGNW